MLTDHFRVVPDNIPNDGILFADLQKEDRSSHLGHALVEYAPSKILAFYPTCSAEDKRYNGHSGYGWMEYKRSEDGGQTWSESIPEPNSKALFDQHCGRSAMCEKAVCTDSGRIILFYLQCDTYTDGHVWEPYFSPLYAISDDQGQTFSEVKGLSTFPGRVWDALYKDGVIYVLFQRGPWSKMTRCGEYELLVSEDNGETFTSRGIVPFANTMTCFYGNMVFTPEGKLLVYCYDECDEHNLKYIISNDCGLTWETTRRTFFARRIRNPQLAYFGGKYIVHGRSGTWGQVEKTGHFVVYTSDDGINWDEGQYMHMRVAKAGAYSNNLVVHMPDGSERLMIQVSKAYEEYKTNVLMYFIEKK